MGDYQKLRLMERCLFVVLLMGLGTAAFLYETYKEAVRADLLLPLLIGFMALCYTVYRGLIWLAVRLITPHD